MCVEGLQKISTYRHIRLAHSNVFGYHIFMLSYRIIKDLLLHPKWYHNQWCLTQRDKRPTCSFQSSSSLYWIAKSVFFLHPAQQKVFQPQLFNSSDNKKGFELRWRPIPIPWPLTPDIKFIRNVWSKQKKSQISLLCPSQCTVLKTLIPLRYTHVKIMKKKCFVELQKYYIF